MTADRPGDMPLRQTRDELPLSASSPATPIRESERAIYDEAANAVQLWNAGFDRETRSAIEAASHALGNRVVGSVANAADRHDEEGIRRAFDDTTNDSGPEILERITTAISIARALPEHSSHASEQSKRAREPSSPGGEDKPKPLHTPIKYDRNKVVEAMTKGTSWRVFALCRFYDSRPFLMSDGVSDDARARAIRSAKRVCQDCVVKPECLAASFHDGDNATIRGGHTPRERANLKRKSPRTL